MGKSFGKTYGYAKATVSTRRPEAFATCDRCGILYQRRDLRYQLDYRGPSLQNLRLLVCPRCYDKPASFTVPLVLPADPKPVLNARPEPYSADFDTVRWTQTQSPRLLETEETYRIPDNSVNDADEDAP